MGIDPGEARIGVAVSDRDGTLAFPRETIAAGEGAIERVVEFVQSVAATQVVVGRPLGLSGNATPSTVNADAFFDELTRALPECEVIAVDERFSTVTASRRLRESGRNAREQRAVIDSAAAAVLLQGYLDAHQN